MITATPQRAAVVPTPMRALQPFSNAILWLASGQARPFALVEPHASFTGVDWGTVIARRVQKSPPRQGGWQMFITGYYGVEFADPTNRLLRTSGNEPPNGWANNPQIEAEIAAWFNAASLDEEKTIVGRLNRLAIDHVVYAPLGAVLRHYAWRKDVRGIGQAPLPLFWGVSKTLF